MPTRQIQSRKLRKISIGDLRDVISIETRGLSAPSFSSIGFGENYSDPIETWAKVETEFYSRIFDGVGVDDKPSHRFTIRYRDGITSETRIRWKGTLYRVVPNGYDDFECRQEYILLYCTIDGDDTKEAAQ